MPTPVRNSHLCVEFIEKLKDETFGFSIFEFNEPLLLIVARDETLLAREIEFESYTK